MEQVRRQYADIKADAPPDPKGKPSAEQLVLLQERKKRVKDFLKNLTEEERLFIKGSQKEANNKNNDGPQKVKHKKKKKSKREEGPVLTLTPKKDPICPGWDTNTHTFNQVITFYSHKNRSNKQQQEDDTIFHGFDRRVCSNLYLQDIQKLHVPKLLDDAQNNLMKWDFLSTTPGLSSEHFFQAAKCLHKYDAEFIMKHLNPMQAAEYGQSRMGLTNAQKEQLVKLGAHPQYDFKMVVSAQGLKDHCKKLSNNGKLLSSASESKPIWVRCGKNGDGLLPRRDDWEDVKAHVMLHIVRHKFRGTISTAPTTATTVAATKVAAEEVDASPPLDNVVVPSESVQALLSLPSIPLFVEHTKNDTTWADGGDGSGSNLLGKAITQALLELAGKVEPAPLDMTKVGKLRRPNNELVDYSFPKITRPSKPQRVENLDVDYLCILDFEATCNDIGPTPKPQEIIEFPTLLLNSRTGEVEQEFHLYIKPDVHPTLSKFCTELTGITQDMVDSGVSLNDALSQQNEWFSKHNIVLYTQESSSSTVLPTRKEEGDTNSQKSFLFVACGDWDLSSCLPRQLRYHKQNVPLNYQRWINIKHSFRDLYKIKPMGMTHMISLLELELIGRHHSGIDDCRNIARICARMLEDGWKPMQTNYWRWVK